MLAKGLINILQNVTKDQEEFRKQSNGKNIEA